MKKTVSMTMADPLFQKLFSHLFPGDRDEHGAIIIAGITETENSIRLLAREVILAKEGIDYVPGTRGYRALTAKFVAEISGRCADQNLCYLAVHCHGGTDQVAFSSDDIASHERGYPALLDITKGGPVGALVFATNAVAGDIWTKQGQFTLSYITIIGSQIRRLYPSQPSIPRPSNPMYDRHVRMFGDVGQEILSQLKVGIIGLGGGGSLLNQSLAHLGVGHIVAIDFDRVELSNRSRIVGTTPWDVISWLAQNPTPWLRKLGKRLSQYKVNVAKRVARNANSSIKYDSIVGNIVDEATASLLKDADFVFLATDTMQSRLVFNALVYQYLIPGMQVGAKVSVNKKTRKVGDIFTVTRPVMPFIKGGCLHCHEVITPSKLQEEALSKEERKAQGYIDDDEISEPSVITLNVQSVAQALNDFLMMFTGLYKPSMILNHQTVFIRERLFTGVLPRENDDCLDCSIHAKSRYAKGDRHRLPCRY